jgi:hypothetical protein
MKVWQVGVFVELMNTEARRQKAAHDQARRR